MTVAAQASKDQTRAVLLAALLGDFGLHHFYLGQPFSCALYLMLGSSQKTEFKVRYGVPCRTADISAINLVDKLTY